ncbi:MAG: non-canonical purine NTP diphosphatase [Flavobacteriaceae bacterium]|nr:non-canonical purine NTP diphosphatase [Flavobacteriaceae bacterium]
MKIVFATHNQHKLLEVQQLMPKSIQLLSLTDIDCNQEIPETAITLEGNAQLKANYVTQHYGYDCFADDTGLEVDALYGAPGVYSARYAGSTNNSGLNMQKLLVNLDGASNRNARFKTVIALNLRGKQYLFEGVCKGKILFQKQGEKGFGYDPIFKPKGFTKSFAEMTLTEKNSISHRGKAVNQLISFLSSL